MLIKKIECQGFHMSLALTCEEMSQIGENHPRGVSYGDKRA